MLNKRLAYFAERLANLPNAPYLPHPISDRMEELLLELNTKHGNRIQMTKNHLGIFARIVSSIEARPILVSAHMDHPLFITQSRNEAIPFGLLSTAQIEASLGSTEWSIPVFLHSSSGDSIGSAELVKTTGQEHAKIRASFKVPKNSHVMWKLPFGYDENAVSLIAADNLINCAICLASLEEVLSTNAEYDITFMFGAIEEVKQLSATGVVLEGVPGRGRITPDWIIFVLEVGPAVMKDALLSACDKYGLPRPEENGGPALRISDDWTLHGQENSGFNLAEHVLLRSVKQLGRPYQHSISGGMCDGSVFTSFGVSSNIAGIALVNPFRHNFASSDFPVHEQVKVSDVNLALLWLSHALINANRYISEGVHSQTLLTYKLDSTELRANRRQITRINIDRKATYIAMKPRMGRGYYFPENIIDRFRFWYAIGQSFAYRIVAPIFS